MLLLTESDRPQVRQVLADDGGYNRRVEDRPATETEVSALLAAHPTGLPKMVKQGYGLFRGDRLVAVAEVVRHWPTVEHAYIGLLQLRAQDHRRGYGRALHEEVICLAAGWPPVSTMRLAIVDSNLAAAASFWEALGYRATGQAKPWINAQGATHTAHLYERPLHPPGARSSSP